MVVAFTFINHVTAVYILLFVNSIFYVSKRIIHRFKVLRLYVGPIAIFSVLIFSYFSIDLILMYFNIPSDEFKMLEANRYHVPNWLGSLISRSVSMPFTLDAVIDKGDIFGLGIQEASKLTFWGYPVHNYFVSSVAISGLMGLMFSALLIYYFTKISRIAPMLAISGVFFLSTSNDLSLSLILCLAPIFIRKYYHHFEHKPFELKYL